MSVQFIVAVGMTFLFPARNAGPDAVPIRLLAVATGVLAMVLLAWWSSLWTVRRLQADFDDSPRILAWYQWLRRGHAILGLVVHALVLQWIGWNALVRIRWGLSEWLLVDQVLLLAPYLILESGSIACFYAVERTFRDCLREAGRPVRTNWTRGEYLLFQVRFQFGLGLAFLFYLGGVDVLARLVPADWLEGTGVQYAGTAMMLGSMLILAPLALRIVLGLEPLPAGPLRSRLEAFSRALGFRFSDILVWPTYNGIANAAVTGVVPQLRYVLLTDALIGQLAPEEIKAVFGHEIGHVKHHHISYYVFFLTASFVLIAFLAAWVKTLLAPAIGQEVWPAAWSAMVPEFGAELLLMVLFVALVFGPLSRHCERQADLFGCRAVSGTPGPIETRPASAAVHPDGARVFIRALEMVALLNGIPRQLWKWRHGSIAGRIEFLQRACIEPGLADRFDRRLRLQRWIAGLALGAGVAVLWWTR